MRKIPGPEPSLLAAAAHWTVWLLPCRSSNFQAHPDVDAGLCAEQMFTRYSFPEMMWVGVNVISCKWQPEYFLSSRHELQDFFPSRVCRLSSHFLPYDESRCYFPLVSHDVALLPILQGLKGWGGSFFLLSYYVNVRHQSESVSITCYPCFPVWIWATRWDLTGYNLVADRWASWHLSVWETWIWVDYGRFL